MKKIEKACCFQRDLWGFGWRKGFGVLFFPKVWQKSMRKWISVTFAKAILCAWVQLHLLSKAMRVFTQVCAFISNYPLFFPPPNDRWNVISCVQLGEASYKTYSSSGYRRMNGITSLLWSRDLQVLVWCCPCTKEHIPRCEKNSKVGENCWLLRQTREMYKGVIRSSRVLMMLTPKFWGILKNAEMFQEIEVHRGN